jgi:hypothetical protein
VWQHCLLKRSARFAAEVEDQILILIANIILLNDVNVIELIYLGVLPSLIFELRYTMIVAGPQSYYDPRNHTACSVCMFWPLIAQWLLYVPPDSTLKNSAFCPQGVLMRSLQIAEQTTIISLYDINFLISITETDCVYCAVRTEPLNKFKLNLGL